MEVVLVDSMAVHNPAEGCMLRSWAQVVGIVAGRCILAVDCCKLLVHPLCQVHNNYTQTYMCSCVARGWWSPKFNTIWEEV